MKSDWGVFITNIFFATILTTCSYFTNISNTGFENFVIFILALIWFYQMDIYRKK